MRTKTDGPLVGVVTPVFNGARYLVECIESSVAQTYPNWRHVIVDNASTDETPEIAERYSHADSRITLVRFEDFLPSAEESHNRAFRQLDPEAAYCKVVQADDWLFPACLERMVEVAERHPGVGVVGAYRSNGGVVDLTDVPSEETVFPGRTILRQCLLGGPYVTGGPTATMLRASLVRERDPFYDPTFWHGDTEGIYWALTVTDMGYVHEVLTYVRRQGGTLTSFADRVGSYVPENIRLLLRYGPGVLTEEEYRGQLARDLRKYVRFHARQAPKLSRLRSKEFFEFHEGEVTRILDECGGDREVVRAMSLVRLLLARGSLVPSRRRHRNPV